MTKEQKDDTTAVATSVDKKEPVAPAKSTTVATRRAPLLAVLNLVLVLLAFVIVGYMGWIGWQQQQLNTSGIAVLEDHIEQARSETGTLAASESDLQQQTQVLTELTAALQAQVEHNTDRLGKLPGAERQDWLLAEVEYLLRMANQRLQLERDWSGALSMLQAADNVLVETRNPLFNPVRAQLAKEMLALREAPALDYTGAVLRLQAIQEQIPQLPWLPSAMSSDPQDAVEGAPQAAAPEWYQRLAQRIVTTFHSLIRIRERDAPMAAPLSPDQQYYLQQNMHLMLEQAQVALLRQNADMYQHSLQRVDRWLAEYLPVGNDKSRAVQSALAELKEWEVAPAIPDISASLNLLQKLLEQQRRGTVQPKSAEGGQ